MNLVHVLEVAALLAAIGCGLQLRHHLRPAPRPRMRTPFAPPPPARPPPKPSPTPPIKADIQELLMSINVLALASRVAAIGVEADQAVTIVGEVVSLIGLAENLYDGVKGDVKFKAVMSGLEAVVDRLGLTDKLAAIQQAVAPIVNLVVTVLNAGSLWETVFGSVATFAKSVSTALGGTKPA